MEEINKSIWEEIRFDKTGEGFRRIDAWKTTDPKEKGKPIALVDMWSGRMIYLDRRARKDPYAQRIITGLSAKAARAHPFKTDRLETLLRNLVSSEKKKPKDEGYLELMMLGFTKEEAAFFGWPASTAEPGKSGIAEVDDPER